MNQTIASHLHGMSTSRHARYTALLSSRRQVPHVTEKVAAMKNRIQYQDTLDQLINGAGGPSTNGSAQLENAYDRQSSRVPNTASIVRSWWSTVPSRTKLVAACGSAFVISNLDKVNMTVAGERSRSTLHALVAAGRWLHQFYRITCMHCRSHPHRTRAGLVFHGHRIGAVVVLLGLPARPGETP